MFFCRLFFSVLCAVSLTTVLGGGNPLLRNYNPGNGNPLNKGPIDQSLSSNPLLKRVSAPQTPFQQAPPNLNANSNSNSNTENFNPFAGGKTTTSAPIASGGTDSSLLVPSPPAETVEDTTIAGGVTPPPIPTDGGTQTAGAVATTVATGSNALRTTDSDGGFFEEPTTQMALDSPVPAKGQAKGQAQLKAPFRNTQIKNTPIASFNATSETVGSKATESANTNKGGKHPRIKAVSRERTPKVGTEQVIPQATENKEAVVTQTGKSNIVNNNGRQKSIPAPGPVLTNNIGTGKSLSNSNSNNNQRINSASTNQGPNPKKTQPQAHQGMAPDDFGLDAFTFEKPKDPFRI